MRTKNHVYDNYSLESLWTGVFVSVIHLLGNRRTTK